MTAAGANRTTGTPLLDARGLSRAFPGVKAVDDVSLALQPGEIHALLGENGAGKSTFVKMLYGVLRPDTGTMHVNGSPYAPADPKAARARGVAMVFQHFSLFEGLTVGENIALGLSNATADRALIERIVTVSKTYGLGLDPGRRVGTLSAGERQRIEIARCLLQEPRLLIMDEPTSVLTPQEANQLFETLRRLAAQGRSILYISHKLDEIRALCSAATILRGGKQVATCDPRQETAKSLAEMMIGTTLVPPQRPIVSGRDVRLSVDVVAIPATAAFGVSLSDVRFDVRAGEIVGIAGVAGNGQSELMEALIGERLAPEATSIVLNGAAVGRLGPIERRRHGAAFLPEERLGHGAVPTMSLTETMALASTERGFLDWATFAARARDVIARFDVRTTGADKLARSLSGGNLQKFIVGREIATAPTVFIANQPTWGVDAGAAAMIHKEITTLAAAGTAIVLISQDLDELFALAHRIAVIAGGRLSAPRPVEDVTAESIGLEMAGHKAADLKTAGLGGGRDHA